MTIIKAYSVTLQWEGKAYDLLVHADCKTVAFSSACILLAEILNLNQYKIRSYFFSHGDQYAIAETKAGESHC
jgi:hypothetical protein